MSFSVLTGIIGLGIISNGGGVWAFDDQQQQGHGPDTVASGPVAYNGHTMSGGTPSISSGGSGAINYNRPYFDDISPRNVTSIVDETAVLKCRVKNKGDRTVSPFYCVTLHRVVYVCLPRKRWATSSRPGIQQIRPFIGQQRQIAGAMQECAIKYQTLSDELRIAFGGILLCWCCVYAESVNLGVVMANGCIHWIARPWWQR